MQAENKNSNYQQFQINKKNVPEELIHHLQQMASTSSDQYLMEQEKKMQDILKAKVRFRFILVLLSILTAVGVVISNNYVNLGNIMSLVSFSLMIAVWIFEKHDKRNPEKELFIIKLLKAINKSS